MTQAEQELLADTTEALDRAYGNFYAPEFSIEIEGVDIKTVDAEIAGVTVEKSVNEAAHFSFNVNNPYDPDKSEFKWTDNPFFDVGKKIVIQVGYANGNKGKEQLLSGIITSIKYSFPASGASQLEIGGYDFLHYTMKTIKSSPALSWEQAKQSDVVQKILSLYSDIEIGEITDTKIKYQQVKHEQKNDYEFIKEVATKNGYDFYITNQNEFMFKDPMEDSHSNVTLFLGKNLLSFSPEFNIAQQINEVKVIGWDASAKKEIIGSAKTAGASGGKSGSDIIGSIIENVTHEVRRPVNSKEEAENIAKSLLARVAQGLIKGSGESLGIPALQPGSTIKLDGLGKRFSQNYYIEKTTHTIGTSGYKTTFNVRRSSI